MNLVGFAQLPADTFADGPPAGADIEANDRVGPFPGQPVQGFSGVQFANAELDEFWFLSDNGFGAQDNSADYLLRIYRLAPDFTTADNGSGDVEILDFIQLADPNNLIPFPIVNEDTAERPLTGADFDIESFTLDNEGNIWIGDEFGPFLLKFNTDGTLLEAPITTPNIVEFNTLTGEPPLVIGHRGASGDRPEHTLEAYELAIAQGADFIEPDLVITADGVLIARHEPLLDDTTNVAEVFPERLTTKNLDGEEITGYFAEDFTLEEIKQLRAVTSMDFRDQSFNGQFEIPTFAEVIELVQEVEVETGREIGIYPETKHPTFFDDQGLSLEEPLIDTLLETGFTEPDRIFIQSFELQNLIELQDQLAAVDLEDIPLVQLFGDIEGQFVNEGGGGFSVPFDFVANFGEEFDETRAREIYGDLVDLIDFSSSPDYGNLANQEVIDYISSYAAGLGPWKNSFLLREDLNEPVDGNGDGIAEITTQLTGEVFPLIDLAHNAGLQIHPYTLRDEERFLTLNPDGTPQTPTQEFLQLTQLGADGFFTDFPGTGRMALDMVTGPEVVSPQNPFLEDPQMGNIARSRGFEGMAISPDRGTIYPILESSVAGDPPNALRIYEFDPETSEYEGLLGFFRVEDPSHAIGDFTAINDSEFLVIERDNNQGPEAAFKQIFKVNLEEIDSEGFVSKELLVDMLEIDDPDDLNGDGSTVFDFPFQTIEDVLVIDENTILVANDNNYPFSVGRPPEIDNNEIILLELDEPLDFTPTALPGDGMPMGEFQLQILHASDQEGGLPAIADAVNFSAVLNALEDDFSNTLKLSSGDIYIPGPFLNASDDVYGQAGIGDILINNALGFQAVAFGNHEWDLGPGLVNDLLRPNPEITGPGIGPEGYPGTAFPYLSTNLDFSGEPDLAELVTEPGEAPQPNSITDSVVIEVGGEPIGVVGATTPSLPSISSIGNITVTPADDTDIEALAAEIQDAVDALTATGIDKVILLTHMQQAAIDIELAELLSDVDVIMAGVLTPC
ncbi:MAG: esterase-like activity of phytase family protein [Hormoscilla sp. GM7CHS1pb]|nr:esterase-like activity of phytase family protein [Hormoscilla sp. GM7CHS1pb]